MATIAAGTRLFDTGALLGGQLNPTRRPNFTTSRRQGSAFVWDTTQGIVPTSLAARSRNPSTPGYGGTILTGSIFAGGVIAPEAKGAARMGYTPGMQYTGGFITQRLDTGAFTNADVAPILTVRRNGAIIGNFLTCQHPPQQSGDYVVTGTIPANLAVGDTLTVAVQATVNGIAGKSYEDSIVLEAPTPTVGQVWP